MSNKPMPELKPELWNRYMRAIHAVQSGVMEKINLKQEPVSQKHLRVGVNSCLISNTALVRLLIQKGVFTIDEYGEELCKAAEREKEVYEDYLSDHYGKKITLM